ncbi:DNA-entry nuclease [Streptococcus agalactiae]|nr:DNA-entry nuclease [Streptococcus agalactiae]
MGKYDNLDFLNRVGVAEAMLGKELMPKRHVRTFLQSNQLAGKIKNYLQWKARLSL